MTEDDQDQIKLETIKEVADLRARLTCLRAKADKFMKQCAQAQRWMGDAMEPRQSGVVGPYPDRNSWPSYDDLEAVHDESVEADRRLTELNSRLRAWGVVD